MQFPVVKAEVNQVVFSNQLSVLNGRVTEWSKSHDTRYNFYSHWQRNLHKFNAISEIVKSYPSITAHNRTDCIASNRKYCSVYLCPKALAPTCISVTPNVIRLNPRFGGVFSVSCYLLGLHTI